MGPHFQKDTGKWGLFTAVDGDVEKALEPMSERGMEELGGGRGLWGRGVPGPALEGAFQKY